MAMVFTTSNGSFRADQVQAVTGPFENMFSDFELYVYLKDRQEPITLVGDLSDLSKTADRMAAAIRSLD